MMSSAVLFQRIRIDRATKVTVTANMARRDERRAPGDGLIRLAERTPIARGSFRACYLHPREPGHCIKVMLDGGDNHRRGIVDRLLGLRDRHPNLREWDEYRRLRNRGVPLDRYFPVIHGIVDTDLGPGLVVDLLRGSDGGLPVSVVDYANGNRPEGLAPEAVLTAFSIFAAFCINHGIFASCDEPGNVGFLRGEDGFRFVSYDLKLRRNKEFLPVSTLIPAVRRRKVARRFAATLQKMAAKLELERQPGLERLRDLALAMACLVSLQGLAYLLAPVG